MDKFEWEMDRGTVMTVIASLKQMQLGYEDSVIRNNILADLQNKYTEHLKKANG